MFSTIEGIDIYSKINRSHTGPADDTPYAVMHTSRGCGAQCTFCHAASEGFNRALIGRSIANIIEELDYLKDKGVKTLSIEDDNFGGFSPRRTDIAVKILEEIEKRDFRGVYFPNGLTLVSYQNNDFALLKKLRDLADRGMKIRTSLPFECGDNETLKELIHKPHDLNTIETVLGELKRGSYLTNPNIELDAFFMVGIVGFNGNAFLSETNQSIQRTFDLARRVAEQRILVNVWWMKPNPGRPQYLLWRKKYPEKPFYELQFLFPSCIWGSEQQELELNSKIAAINREMAYLGVGSKGPIYPVDQ